MIGVRVGNVGGQPMTNYREWQVEAGQLIEAILAVLSACERTCVNRVPTALLSDADQLLAVSRNIDNWIPSHLCPYPDLGVQLARVARSYAYLATSHEALVRSAPWIDWRIVEREIRGLHTLVAETLFMMNKGAVRES